LAELGEVDGHIAERQQDARRFVRACSKELFEIIQLVHDT